MSAALFQPSEAGHASGRGLKRFNWKAGGLTALCLAGPCAGLALLFRAGDESNLVRSGAAGLYALSIGAGLTLALRLRARDRTPHLFCPLSEGRGGRQLDHLIRAMPGVLFQLRRDGAGAIRVPFVSPGTYSLLGCSSAELSQSPEAFLRCIDPLNTGEVLASLDRSAAALTPWHYEARIEHPERGSCWVRFSATPIRDVAQGAVTWHGFAMEITVAKQSEQALRESERRLRLTQFAVDNMRDSVAFLSAEGDRLYVNEEACRLTGYTREELLGSKIWSTFTHFGQETYRQMWEELKRRRTHMFEAPLRTKSGDLRSAEVAVTFIDFAGQEIVFAIARDVSARKAAEIALRESEQRLRLTQFALDHAQDLVSVVDREGNRLSVNERFCSFTGYSAEELRDAKVWEAIPSLNQDRFQALWDDVKRCGTLTFEMEVRTKTGELKPLEMNASHLNFGGREAICTISRDLTLRRAAEAEKRRMQQQLQETQKLESLGVLAGGIAHDFNNLLTGVLGNASLARDRIPEDSDLHEPLRQIERSAMRAAELCQQMLAYAGKGRFVVELINLSVLVEDTAKLLDLSIAHRARLELHLDAGVAPVLADATQLRQIVMNLVLNAAESINHGNGVISVRTGETWVDAAYLAGVRVAAELPEGRGVYLEVRDNGSGMDAATLDRIFEPFFTTKFTGRGLGLAAVLGIVRSHKGALDVTSTPGVGTTFRLVLAAQNSLAPASRHTPPIFSARAPQDGCVLVVDDEESVRSVAQQALERSGFQIDTASDGEAALALLRAKPRGYTAILLDYMMPRLDGAQTLREIRRINPHAIVILMSGFSEMEARARVHGGKLAGFIQKPFDIGTLRKRIDEVIRREQEGAAEDPSAAAG